MQTFPVQYLGEFVLTSSGSLDFGEIPCDIARHIHRQAGKIRLRIGRQVNGEKGNYGEAHIEREERMSALKKSGFDCARDFIECVCKDYTAIYQGESASLILEKEMPDRKCVAIIRLVPSADGDFYDVQTAYPARKSRKNKKPLLWNTATVSE